MPDPYASPSTVDVFETTAVHPNARQELRHGRPIAGSASRTISLWEPLEDAAQSVYTKLLGTEMWRVAETNAPLTNPISASVYFAGAWKGALVVECSMGQAMRWASQMMESGAEASVEDAVEGLMELAGTIAGRLTPQLPPGVSMSLPWVVEGSGHRSSIRSGRTDRLEFEDGAGRFRVTLSMQTAE